MGDRVLHCALVLAVCAGCGQTEPTPPPACEPISPKEPGLGDDVVWGFADLHAHPAIEKAFSGALIWGTAIDDAPINAAELPRIAACPVETHLTAATGPLDRAVGEQIFPEVANIAGFAHAPVGTAGERPTHAWPNARDVVHQQMNVASIRRAYEGGLRLMFASTTDDQVIAALLTGPSFVDGFVPRKGLDALSAQAQFELIRDIVRRNQNWMGIATTPTEARCLIKSGRLALVLSLEMNGFTSDDELTNLVGQGARHVFPIHLIDNANGGTAANSELFNAASAAVSQLYREDGKRMQYMNIVPTGEFAPSLRRPSALYTLDPPLYVDLQDVPYEWYQGLCYEPLAACQREVAEPRTSFLELGAQNLKGLCTTAAECASGARPGAANILAMMKLDAGVMIDISHMSARSALETLNLDAGFPFPLIASHGDVAHLCRGLAPDAGCVPELEAPTERAVDVDVARALVARNGVLGLGTGLGVYDGRAVLTASGVPLLRFEPGGAHAACVQMESVAGGADGCAPARLVDLADAGTALDALHIETVGGVSGHQGNAQPFARIELRDPVGDERFQHHVVMVPLTCSATGCEATADLGTRSQLTAAATSCEPLQCGGGTCTADAYTVDDIEDVSLQWLFLECGIECQRDAGASVAARQCANTWNDPQAPHWTLNEVHLTGARNLATVAELARLGPKVPAPMATLGSARGTFSIYARGDRPSVNTTVPASGQLLKVSLTSGGLNPLLGASAQQVGANVCVAVRQKVGGTCQALPPPPAGARECPDGWVSINQRGEWKFGLRLDAFVRVADASAVCGLDVAMLDWAGKPFEIDEIQIAQIEDPVGHWIRRYAQVSRFAAGGRLGAVAFGTDFNGLNGVTDISEFPVPAGALEASACPADGPFVPFNPAVCPAKNLPAPGRALPLAPLRLRNADGTLGEEVRIDERGLATYGLLADFVAIAKAYPGCGTDVHDSLMLSAEATLRAWEDIAEPGQHPGRTPLPARPFACGTPPGVTP